MVATVTSGVVTSAEVVGAVDDLGVLLVVVKRPIVLLKVVAVGIVMLVNSVTLVVLVGGPDSTGVITDGGVTVGANEDTMATDLVAEAVTLLASVANGGI